MKKFLLTAALPVLLFGGWTVYAADVKPQVQQTQDVPDPIKMQIDDLQSRIDTWKHNRAVIAAQGAALDSMIQRGEAEMVGLKSPRLISGTRPAQH